MTLFQTLSYWAVLGRTTGKRTKMKVRKLEFLTEIILSVFIVGITISEGGNPEFAAGAIAVIHSFNVARAFEAYKEAKIETDYRQSTLDEK